MEVSESKAEKHGQNIAPLIVLLQRLDEMSPEIIKQEYSLQFYQYWKSEFHEQKYFSTHRFKKWLMIHQHTLEEVGGIGGKILDIGCGTGLQSLAYYYSGAYHVTGIDIHHGAVRGFRRLLQELGLTSESVAVIQGDIIKNRFSDESFDILIVNESLSHINGSIDINELLKEFYRILTPGGVLYIKDGNNTVYHLINPYAYYRYKKMLAQIESSPVGEWDFVKTMPDGGSTWKIDYSQEEGGPGSVGWCFREVRFWYIRKHFPQLSEAIIGQLSIETQGLYGEGIQEAVRHYLQTGKLPVKPQYPYVDPINGEIFERRFNPYRLIHLLEDEDFSCKLLPVTWLRGDEKGMKRAVKLALEMLPAALNGVFPTFRILAKKPF